MKNSLLSLKTQSNNLMITMMLLKFKEDATMLWGASLLKIQIIKLHRGFSQLKQLVRVEFSISKAKKMPIYLLKYGIFAIRRKMTQLLLSPRKLFMIIRNGKLLAHAESTITNQMKVKAWSLMKNYWKHILMMTKKRISYHLIWWSHHNYTKENKL